MVKLISIFGGISIFYFNWRKHIATFFHFTTFRCSAKFRALLDFLSQGLQRAHIPSWRTHLSTSFFIVQFVINLLFMAYNHSAWVSCFQPHTCLRTKFTHTIFYHNSICFPLYFLPGCFPSDFQFLSLPLWHISSVRDSAVLAFVEQSDSWFLYASVHHLATKSLIVLTCQFVNMKLYFMWALFVAFLENLEILKHLFASASIWFW